MEALLCTPTARTELLFGKWLAVAVVACASVLGQMIGLLFAVSFLTSGGLDVPEISFRDLGLLMLSVILFAILLPVFNITLAMREALMGIYDPMHILMWTSTSIIYAVGAIWWASRQFNREDLVESLS